MYVRFFKILQRDKKREKYLHVFIYLKVSEDTAPNVCKHYLTSIDSLFLHVCYCFNAVHMY